MKKQIAVILCGCGFKDGSEIHESVCSLLAIDNAGASYQCFAPVGPQARVVNHLTGKVEVKEERSMLQEAARIARGDIKNISELRANDFDALILPGGFGVATNLCNFAEKGASCEVLPEVARVIKDFHTSKKPIGFICIAPVIAAKVLGSQNVELTIGTDKDTGAALTAMGAVQIDKSATDIHIDSVNRIVTTPAYMNARGISEVYVGVSKLVNAVIGMA